ncbi:hypothetical protein [Pseudomonas sichuanensis]|uniref:hypothetical protein n=1 Tax=Pseudomonas TaxID=286 RepID=UPI0036EBC82D
MTENTGWTPTIADAYANSYGEVAHDFLSLVVEPSLAALEQKDAEIAAQEDQSLAAFRRHDHQYLIAKTSMALCLGIQSLWEQQLRDYLCKCWAQVKHATADADDIRDAIWDSHKKDRSLKRLFCEIRGLSLEDFQSYNRLDKLQLLGNVCRHGEGTSAKKLRRKYPELWSRTLAECEQLGALEAGLMPVDGMLITVALLRDLVNAVVLFWLDIQIACTAPLIPKNASMNDNVARLQALRPTLL